MKQNKRETNLLEYKLNVSSAFLKTVSAFANYGTGNIVFGVDDFGIEQALDDMEDTCLKIENMINDNLRPAPRYVIDANSSKGIITLTVFEGFNKPYFVKNKAYKRSDTATVEVDRFELNRLILEGVNQNFEDLNAFSQELAFNCLEKKLVEIMHIEGLHKDILKTLDLFSDRDGYNRAAELLADQNNYPGIDLVVFGDTIDELRYRETFEGVSAIAQYDLALDVFKKNYQYDLIEGSRRNLVERIPEKAFREAVVNALVHREWDVRAHIKIAMHPDRIEIISPGGLLSGISKNEYLNGQVSIFRNPKLGSVFFRLRYIEKFGTGISRIKNAYLDYLIKPDFKLFDNSIAVILPIIELNYSDLNLEHEELKIIQVLKGKSLTRLQIEQLTHYSKDKSVRLLNGLIEKRIIGKSGQGKSTRYHDL